MKEPKQTTASFLPGEEVTKDDLEKLAERSQNSGPWRCSMYWHGVDRRKKREEKGEANDHFYR